MRLSMIIGTAALIAAPALVQAGDWTGGYVGAQLGYGWADSGTSGDGVTGGVHGGYLSDMGDFVIGGEIDYDAPDFDFGDGDSIDGITRLKAKFGSDLGNTLVYATAGAAFASGSFDGTDYDDTGWFAGIGVDRYVTDTVTIGAELLYNDFGEFDDSGRDVDATTLAVRASYHF